MVLGQNVLEELRILKQPGFELKRVFMKIATFFISRTNQNYTKAVSLTAK